MPAQGQKVATHASPAQAPQSTARITSSEKPPLMPRVESLRVAVARCPHQSQFVVAVTKVPAATADAWLAYLNSATPTKFLLFPFAVHLRAKCQELNGAPSFHDQVRRTQPANVAYGQGQDHKPTAKDNDNTQTQHQAMLLSLSSRRMTPYPAGRTLRCANAKELAYVC